VPPVAAATTDEPQPPSSRQFKADRWHALELFIAAQFLWGALLFVPGAQAFRALIRALPYVTSALMALAYIRRVPKLKPPIAASFLVGALAVMGDSTAINAAAAGDIWVAYPMNPAPGQRWVPYGWFFLGLFGTLIQMFVTGGQSGRVVKPNKKQKPKED